MVKGGTKRTITIEKITKKNSLATCFTKRSYGLYSKASQLCLLSGAQILILATPSSSQSNVSFYSFGHSSVDAVVSAFLAGKRPVPVPSESKQAREDIGICLARNDLGLGFWWDDDKILRRSENPEEIMEAIESMKILLSDAKRLRSEDAMNQRDHHQAFVNDNDLNVLDYGADQSLNLQSISAISENLCFTDDSNIRTLNVQPNCRIHDDCLRTDTEIVVLDDDLPENLNNTQEQDQILAISDSLCVTVTDSNNNGLPVGKLDDEGMDLDQLLDFETSFGDIFNDQEELDEFVASLWSEDNKGSLVTEERDQILAISDNLCVTVTDNNNNNNNDLPAGKLDDERMDFDQLIDFERCFEGIFNDQEELDEFATSLWSEDNKGSLI